MDKAVTSNITPPSLPGDVQMSLVTCSLPKPMNDDAVRHCAFCLQLCSPPVKICGRCKKRAYCSKKCQKKDWPSTSPGQHHKNWCGIHECGEEDIDWEVVPVPGKGLIGIVAKKFIPTGFKIMVEAIFYKPEDNPAAFRDGGLLLTEGTDKYGGEPYGKSLRISKINHGCRPNANNSFDDGADVMVIYALQDIQPGEEIVFSYIPLTRIDPIRPNSAGYKSLKECIKERGSLLRKHGVVCLSDCYCQNRQVWELAWEWNVLYTVHTSAVNCKEQRDLEVAIETGEKLLDVEKRLNNSFDHQCSIHFALFYLILLSKNREILMAKALQHLEEGTKISRSITPYSETTLVFGKFLEDPEAAVDTILHKAEAEGLSSIFLDADDD